jgi:hypothetical protein
VQDQVATRKLLIYRDTDGEHPVNAAELTNSTGKTLDGGPITIYDGGAYAGEALVETLKASDKRLIGYAVDYGTRISTAFGDDESVIREIHANAGQMHIRTAFRQDKTYTARNVDAKPKTLLVEFPVQQGFQILEPSVAERSPTAYRFQLALRANETETLKVRSERVGEDTTVIYDAPIESLLLYVNNKSLSDKGRRQLGQVVTLKQQLADLDSSIASAQLQMDQMSKDQARLRQNLDSLNRVTGQQDRVTQYAQQLADEDAKITQLRDTLNNTQAQRTRLYTELRTAADKLDF